MDNLLRRVLRLASSAAGTAVTGRLRRRTTAPGRRTSTRGAPAPARPQAPGRAPGREAGGARAGGTGEYDVRRLGLPALTYGAVHDDRPDPGEVVWTWVPYEEDASQGKDRPVLVLARAEGALVVAQMTSQDHDRDAAQEARHGRYWIDVGAGAWDAQGRPSEVRLDRLLWADPADVRRQGAALDRKRFEDVAEALRAHHR